MKRSNEDIELQLIAVRVPKAWQIRKIAGSNGYMTLAEFVRFLVKKEVDRYWEKQRQICR